MLLPSGEPVEVDVLVPAGAEDGVLVDGDDAQVVSVFPQYLQLRDVGLVQVVLGVLYLESHHEKVNPALLTILHPHLPDLDELTASADRYHVPIVRHPDLVHALVVVLVAPPVPSRPDLHVGHEVEGRALLLDGEEGHLALPVTEYHVRVS